MKKHKLKYIYYKKKGNSFGFQVVGYNLVERMEMCLDLLTSGVVSVNSDLVLKDKDSDLEIETQVGGNQ